MDEWMDGWMCGWMEGGTKGGELERRNARHSRAMLCDASLTEY
jgi:hypothetical protein